jgi:hypothetical protein
MLNRVSEAVEESMAARHGELRGINHVALAAGRIDVDDRGDRDVQDIGHRPSRAVDRATA